MRCSGAHSTIPLPAQPAATSDERPSHETAHAQRLLQGYRPRWHARNFLDCVKSRENCNCDIETGHRSTSATLLANIAHKTKAYLEWDARAEKFTTHPRANKLLRYDYRAPYRL